MKKVIRNDLWLMIIAWCLLLNGYSILGILISVVASIYLVNNTKYIKRIRLLSMSFAFILINSILFYLTAAYAFEYFPFFCLSVSLNVALLNERLYKERLSSIEPIAIIMVLSLIIFMSITAILPNSIIFYTAKNNMYSLIVLIFIPYTSEIIISMLIKLRNRRKWLDKLKKVETSKVYYN